MEKNNETNLISSSLPCVFVRGMPKSLDTMNTGELKLFIQHLLTMLQADDMMSVPNWWAPRVDYSDFIKNADNLSTFQLKEIIEFCYLHHNQKSLLVFSEQIAKCCDQLKILPLDENTSAIYLLPSQKLLFVTANEHLVCTYWLPLKIIKITYIFF